MMGHFIYLLADQAKQNKQGSDEPTQQRKDPAVALREALQKLYASGRIDRDSYLRYEQRAEDGVLSWRDIDLLREGKAEEFSPAEVEFRAEREALRKERISIQNLLSTFTERQVNLLREVEKLEAKAKANLEDGLRARELFSRKLEREEELERVEGRVTELKLALEKLSQLEAKLKDREAELKADQVSERISQLEAKLEQ